MTDLRHALVYLFRVHPGEQATAEDVVPRIDSGLFPTEAVAEAISDLERTGRIEPIPSGGWRAVPDPDPADAMREALRTVVDEPDPDVMTRVAADALAANPPQQSHAGQRRA